MLLVSHKNLDVMKLLQCRLFKDHIVNHTEISHFSLPVGSTASALSPGMCYVFSSVITWYFSIYPIEYPFAQSKF